MKLISSKTTLRVLLVVALTALIATAGCSSGGSSHLAFVATGNGIFAFRIDNNSGNATSVFSAPFVVGNSPSAIVVTPSNQFAYVTNQVDNTISLLKVDATGGTLTEVQPRTKTGISPGAMIMDSTGSFLFVADQGTNDVEVFSIASNGTLKLVSTASVGSSPTSLALSNSGNLLYVAVPNFSAIYAFTVNSGALTPVTKSPFFVANGLASVSVDAQGSFLYAPSPGTNTIAGFATNSGPLTPLPGSPYGTTASANQLTTPVAIVTDPGGKFLYVANFAVSAISGFNVASNGDITPLLSAAGSAGTNPNLITFDPDGKFLYVGNSGGNSITIFSLDSSGILSSSSTIQVGTVARGMAFTK